MQWLAHGGAAVLGFVPWLLWWVAARIHLGALLLRHRNARPPLDAEGRETFFGRGRRRLHPVLVTGVADGSRALEWSYESLRSSPEPGQRMYRLKDPNARCIFLISPEWASRVSWEPNVPWAEAVDRVLAPGDEKPVARFQVIPEDSSRFRTEAPPQPAGWSRSFWFQSRGAVTPFHYDTRQGTVTQIRGRKRFLLASPFDGYTRLQPFGVLSMKGCYASRIGLHAGDPREERLLGPAGGMFYEATLGPGDTLYIPPYWWHHAECLEGSISMIQAKPLQFAERLHPLMARALLELWLRAAVNKVEGALRRVVAERRVGPGAAVRSEPVERRTAAFAKSEGGTEGRSAGGGPRRTD
jgi:hypothetical protein